MTEAPISPLRRRMIEDMTIRKFTPRTPRASLTAERQMADAPRRRALQEAAAAWMAERAWPRVAALFARILATEAAVRPGT